MLEFTAETARRMSGDNIDMVSKTQVEEIFELIKKEISIGRYSSYYYGVISDRTKTKLQDLGYKIQNESNQHDGTQYLIAW